MLDGIRERLENSAPPKLKHLKMPKFGRDLESDLAATDLGERYRAASEKVASTFGSADFRRTDRATDVNIDALGRTLWDSGASPAHARELAKLLPGWAVWTANDLEIKTPNKACGVIATELAADETVILAGVLIRATGTKYPLPDIDWPWKDEVRHGVPIDFRDTYHPVSSLNAQARRDRYREAKMTVYTCAE